MEERLNAVFKRIFDVSEADLATDRRREDIWNWDSLRHLALVTTLESEFAIRLTIDEIHRMESLQAIRTVVAEKMISYERL